MIQKKTDFNLTEKDKTDLNKRVLNRLSNVNKKYRKNYKSVAITKLFLFTVISLAIYYWDIFSIFRFYLDTVNDTSVWYYTCISVIWLVVILFILFVIKRYSRVRLNFKEYDPRQTSIFDEKTYKELNRFNQLNVIVWDALRDHTSHLKEHKKVIYLQYEELDSIQIVKEYISFLNPILISNEGMPYTKTPLDGFVLLDVDNTEKLFNGSNKLPSKECRIVYDENVKIPYITYKISDRYYTPTLLKGTRFDFTIHVNPSFFSNGD